MYARKGYSKYKHRLVVLLYLAILLAEFGEFFVEKISYSTNHEKGDNHSNSLEFEIPDHIPEEGASNIKIQKGSSTNKYHMKEEIYSNTKVK